MSNVRAFRRHTATGKRNSAGFPLSHPRNEAEELNESIASKQESCRIPQNIVVKFAPA
jgi:hypothetical protein